KLVHHRKRPAPVSAGDELPRQLRARDETFIRRMLGTLRRGAPGTELRGGDGQADRDQRQHSRTPPHSPIRLMIMAAAGPSTTANSDGRMHMMSGIVIFTDAIAALSSASCIRLVRMPSA